MEANSIRVGIGVMVWKDGKLLLMQRKGAHGRGDYGFPGGHLEYMESFAECAQRETREEAGIEIDNIRFLMLANVTDYAPKHYVHIGLMADWKEGEPQILEPDKNGEWGWYDLNDLPQPLFKPAQVMIDAYQEKRNYLDK